MTSLQQKLMRDKKFNAFNNAFDSELLLEEIKKAVDSGADIKEVSPALVSPFFNSIYSQFYYNAKEILSKQILTRDEFEQLILANFNREFLLLMNDMESSFIEQSTSKGAFIPGEANNFKIQSNSMKREVYAIDGMENSLDAINILFSYLQYKERTHIEEDMDEENALQHLFVLSMMGNQVAALKNTYDAIIWCDSYVDVDNNNNIYSVHFNNRKLEEIFAIGKFRIEQLTSAKLMHFLSMLTRNQKVADLLKKLFSHKRKPRSIKSTKVKDGYITYQLKKGVSDELIMIDARIYASITSYYEYIEDVILPHSGTLAIKDIAIMFAELYELLHTVESAKPSTGNHTMTVDDFYDYPFRITTEKLLQYLIAKTKYTIKEIKSLIDILTHEPETRVNLWKRPFIRQGSDLLFALMPILSANTLYIIDEWLTAGGYSLDNRGPIFEKYLKKELQEAMANKGFMCKIHPNSTLRINDKAKEEVDLIAEFSDCILVAEVKCIGYPTEARDQYNAVKRYTEGAKQLNRKVKFLERYRVVFSKDILGLANKPIVKAVIANYPLLNGYSIEDVPCMDVNSLMHYINEGAIDKGLVSEDTFGKKDTSKSQRIVYYKDEKEFCQNLHNHLSDPVSVNSLQECCNWEMIELTGKNFQPRVFVETLKIKQDHLLEI